MTMLSRIAAFGLTLAVGGCSGGCSRNETPTSVVESTRSPVSQANEPQQTPDQVVEPVTAGEPNEPPQSPDQVVEPVTAGEPNEPLQSVDRRAKQPAQAQAVEAQASASVEPVSGTDSTAQQTDDAPQTPDVIYVPTPQPVVDQMLEMAKVQESDVVYDLGCGDGRIVVTAAKRYGTRAYGFDVDPKRVAEARANVRNNGVEHLVTIHQKDIFTLDLSPADVVTLYLLPELNVRLIPQLEMLKPGSRIVSHDFDMKPIDPLKHVKIEYNDKLHDVYLWHAPL